MQSGGVAGKRLNNLANPFTQQMFVEHLFCAKICSRGLEHVSEQETKSLLSWSSR